MLITFKSKVYIAFTTTLNIRVICRSAIALAIAVIRKKLKLFYSSLEFNLKKSVAHGF